MEYDKLVNLIVEEVLKKLNKSTYENTSKKVAVIFNKDDLQKYSEIMEPEYEVVLFNENIKDCNIVVITKLCLKGMANLANLICSTKEESFVIKMLMQGKKIYISEDGLLYKKYKSSAPKQVYNKYLEFENILKNYGIEVMNDSISNNSVENNIDTVNLEKSISISKKLITEADIRKQHILGNKVIFIDKKSVITPLAKDYIKMNHIEILNKEG